MACLVVSRGLPPACVRLLHTVAYDGAPAGFGACAAIPHAVARTGSKAERPRRLHVHAVVGVVVKRHDADAVVLLKTVHEHRRRELQHVVTGRKPR